MSDREVLDVGVDRRPGLPWRARLVLGAGLLALALVALLLDRELRSREERAIGRCASEVTAAVDMAGRRVRAAYEYVRPALFNPSPELQESARRLIATSAAGADDRLTSPRERCTGITVFALHDGLQARRDRCLDVLEAQRQGLLAVADDGGSFSAWSRTPRSC